MRSNGIGRKEMKVILFTLIELRLLPELDQVEFFRGLTKREACDKLRHLIENEMNRRVKS